MSNLLNVALAAILNYGANEAAQYETEILAMAKEEGLTVDKAIDLYIDSLKVGGALGFVLGSSSLKAAVKAQIDAEIKNQAVAEEKVLLDLIIQAAKNEAVKLGG